MKTVDKARMKCNSPQRAPSWHSKKFIVKACSNGKEKVVGYGDRSMTIKKSNPERRANFRARHNCSDKKDKLSAGYWACKVRNAHILLDITSSKKTNHGARRSQAW